MLVTLAVGVAPLHSVSGRPIAAPVSAAAVETAPPVAATGMGARPAFPHRYRYAASAIRLPFAAIRVLPTYLGHGSITWIRVFTSWALPALNVILSALWVYS